jgi:hypothetical protein
MDVNKDGYSLYSGEWNEKQLFGYLRYFVNQICKSKSDTLILHDLGDMDGWDGTAVGHKLQNMDNQGI